MSEQDRRRYDSPNLRVTRLAVLEVVSQNPGISVSEINSKFTELFELLGTDALPFGPGKPWQNFEQLLHGMAGEKHGLLKKKGIDGTSTFEVSYQGGRTLALAKMDKPTPQY